MSKSYTLFKDCNPQKPYPIGWRTHMQPRHRSTPYTLTIEVECCTLINFNPHTTNDTCRPITNPVLCDLYYCFSNSSLGFFLSPFKVSTKITSLGNNAIQFILSIFAASVIFLVLFYIPVGIVVRVGIEAFLGCCVLVSMKQYTIVIVAFSSFAMVSNQSFFANLEEIYLI